MSDTEQEKLIEEIYFYFVEFHHIMIYEILVNMKRTT